MNISYIITYVILSKYVTPPTSWVEVIFYVYVSLWILNQEWLLLWSWIMFDKEKIYQDYPKPRSSFYLIDLLLNFFGSRRLANRYLWGLSERVNEQYWRTNSILQAKIDSALGFKARPFFVDLIEIGLVYLALVYFPIFYIGSFYPQIMFLAFVFLRHIYIHMRYWYFLRF